MESVKSIALLALAEDLPELVTLLTKAEDSDEKGEIARTIVIVAKKIPVKENRSDLIIERYNATENEKDRFSLMYILISLGNKKSIPVIQNALYQDAMRVDPGILSAIADQWPKADTEIMTELYKIASGSGDIIQSTKALRGYIRLIGIENAPPPEKVALYQKALDVAKAKGITVEEMVLSGLGRTPCYEALKIAAAYLDEKRLQAEAESAIMAIAPATLRSHPGETRIILKKMDQTTQDDYRRKQIERLLQE
jgi:hypothetical protein